MPGWFSMTPKPLPTATPTSTPTPLTGCSRTQEYPYPEEFKRAVSLVKQRLDEGKTTIGKDYAQSFQRIRNCLDIQYAASDKEMNDTEGYFSFSKSSTANRLEILVSPRYKIKDDLLTAILLSHEMTHAAIFAAGETNTISCYVNEAAAFMREMVFISTLNSDEIASITYRSNNGYPEARGIINFIVEMSHTKAKYLNEKTLEFVRTSDYYQWQCGEE
jgi:hypothetical protein